uniref:F-box/LRR-repeat protein 12 n=1 Tax=Kalanchoe fedtschenkoi TaxID=63787 RepID=A0A7N0UJ49_KALFE
MEELHVSGGTSTSIMHLPDDCLMLIFSWLNQYSDRESFGLTCHRWFHIQNISRRALQFSCSFQVNLTSLSWRSGPSINSLHLSRLLARFQHLQSLSLSGCTELPDSGLSHLQLYGSKLRYLNLDCCFGITDQGLEFVGSGCPSLVAISFSRCYVNDSGLECLAKYCTGLLEMNLSYCSFISDNGIRCLTQHCRELRSVKISHCRRVAGSGFRGCSPSLSCLEADSCKLEMEGIRDIISGGGLEYLNISSLMSHIRGQGLAQIGSGSAAGLIILDLRMCRDVGDDSIVAISRGCPLLEEWNLSLCHGVKISGWESIAFHCGNLKTLHVNRCRNLCDRGLQALQQGCKHLAVLYMSLCCRITPSAVELFKLYRGDVEIKGEEIMSVGIPHVFY